MKILAIGAVFVVFVFAGLLRWATNQESLENDCRKKGEIPVYTAGGDVVDCELPYVYEAQ